MPGAPAFRSVHSEAVLQHLQRARAELAMVVRAIPPRHASPSALARWLMVDQNLAQRLLWANRAGSVPLFATRMPGVAGLGRVLASLALKPECAGVRENIQNLDAAWADAVGAAGNSQAKLLRLLRESEHASEGPVMRGAAHLLDAAEKVMGVSCSLTVCLTMFVPASGQRIRTITTPVLSGLRASGSHVPITCMRAMPGAVGAGAVGVPVVLEEFSTRPLPVVLSVGPEGFTRDVLDVSRVEGDQSITVTMLVDTLQEASSNEALGMCLVTRVPTRQLEMLMLVHESFIAGPVERGVFYTGAGGSTGGNAPGRWFDKLGEPGTVRWCGPDEPSPAPRGLLEYIADRAKVSLSAFRVLRWSVPVPLWTGDHTLLLHPADGGEGAEGGESAATV